MPIPLIVVAAVSTAATVYSTVQQKKGADAAANTATATANYNAKVDEADAKQTDLDALANIRAMRKDAAVYLSRQESAYVGSGVRADTGSPLAVRVATAGKLALQQQQMFATAGAKEDRYRSAAQVGMAEGQAKADMYHMEGLAAVANGAAKMASILGGAYQAGAFSSTGSTDLSAGLDSPTPTNLMQGG